MKINWGSGKCMYFIFMILIIDFSESRAMARELLALESFFSAVVEKGIPSVPLEVDEEWEPEHTITTKFGGVNYVTFLYWTSVYSKVDQDGLAVLRKYLRHERSDVRYLAGMIGLRNCGIEVNTYIAEGYSLADICRDLDSQKCTVASAIVDSHLLLRFKKMDVAKELKSE
jgi:hypothetical protein